MLPSAEAETASGFTPSSRQLEAIEAPLGPVLVLAGPGAGKTFCLIERIRFLIEQKGFDPARICAVTFTNKAAEEIGERLEKSLGERGRGVKGGTLHALCAEILREHGEWIGAHRGFGIADEEYQKDVLRRLGVWDKRRGWLLTRFGLHRARGVELTPEDLGIFQRYCQHLEHRNLLDFDDLVIRTASLLENYGEIADQVAARWDYLLVDEFQDLTPKQYDVVRRLARGHRNLCVVGDDEQSVFSWTGADPQVLRQFLNDFRLDHMVVLDENRRTARQIFESARRLLQQNPSLFDEKILKAERESEYPVSALGFDDEHAEARWLLADLVADQGRTARPWGDYGVLYRKHEIGDTLEAEFIRAGIPCRMASGRALQDDPVVRYLVAALRVIAEPGDPLRQEAFARVVLPPMVWSTIASEAERKKQDPVAWMRTVAKRLAKDDETGKKLRRADYALQNLPALGRKHSALAGLVEDLLSQRVGEYRTVLEDRHDELSDPASDPEVVALADRLRGALHGRRRVWLPRMGGLELALSGLLLRAGVTSVAYLDGAALPREDDVTISPQAGGRPGLALGLFKALQMVHAGALQDAFRDFVSVDLETTDKDIATCDIVELGAVRVREGRVVDRYQQLVRPRVPITEGAQKTHGITEEQLRDQPTLDQVWAGFKEFCGTDILVAHNGNGFDFPILRRLGGELLEGDEFVTFDSLPLARDLHPGSRKLEDLAHHFGIALPQAHRAHDDAHALALVFLRLQAEKLARARKTALVHLLDYLGLALALSDAKTLTEEAKGLWKVARAFALGRFSDCLEHYRLERAAPGAFDAPSMDEVIRRLGGQRRLEQYRMVKAAGERYPAAMARLRRLLDDTEGGRDLADQLREFLNRVALSRSDVAEKDSDLGARVNLLTLHSTKGLEFSRVYIVGAEDAQLPGMPREGRDIPEADLQESRRLLYVGMTRAKDRLVMTRAERRKDLSTGGYRFLEEMGFTPRPPE
ncbi:MAG TPA: UvrD-helicase domain-containing protein [Gemmatimonadales bacterium]|nr:UvrD-helicase domain-containing protein [Gemmatimonadales bacterium]